MTQNYSALALVFWSWWVHTADVADSVSTKQKKLKYWHKTFQQTKNNKITINIYPHSRLFYVHIQCIWSWYLISECEMLLLSQYFKVMTKEKRKSKMIFFLSFVIKKNIWMNNHIEIAIYSENTLHSIMILFLFFFWYTFCCYIYFIFGNMNFVVPLEVSSVNANKKIYMMTLMIEPFLFSTEFPSCVRCSFFSSIRIS